ncbi:MAG: hypothetical protein SGI77_21740 [Pirellulaceae bacterium]|nr:hypothetical protein [Pirellulaceae bacterium]
MTQQMPTDSIDADDELLTCYLDQELSTEERAQLEVRLIDDEALRQRLAQMRRTWELLDELPETPLNQHFTQSTLELVAIDLEKFSEKKTFLGLSIPGISKVSRRTTWLVVTGFSILAGSLFGMNVRQKSLVKEARDLVLANARPMLIDFPDLDMLRQLKDAPAWKDLLQIESLRDGIIPSIPENSSRETVAKWSSRLVFHEKEMLYNQMQMLERMPVDERIDLENRYEELRSQPDADELYQVGTAMYGVLQSLKMNQRANIRSLPNDRKVIAVRQEACLILALRHIEKMSADEKAFIDKWARSELFNYLRDTSSSPSYYDQNPRLEDMLYWRLYSTSAATQFGFDAAGQYALLESLYQGVSVKTQRLFDGVSPNSQLYVLATWILNRRPEMRTEKSVDEMFEIYKRLSPDSKEDLDMRRSEDTQRYLESKDRKGRPKGPGGPGVNGGPNGPSGKNGPSAPFGAAHSEQPGSPRREQNPGPPLRKPE